MEYANEEESDKEDDQNFMKGDVSETEVYLEIQSEVESDAEPTEPTEPQEDVQDCSGPIYTAKSGL